MLYAYAPEPDEEDFGTIAVDGEHGRIENLSPEDARILAGALLDAADAADEAVRRIEEHDDETE